MKGTDEDCRKESERRSLGRRTPWLGCDAAQRAWEELSRTC